MVCNETPSTKGYTMAILQALFVIVYAEVRYRWVLFLNRKLIKELKRLSAQDPKLYIKLRLSETNPRKIKYDMHYLD